ncbi:MAG TPA: neutral zinc metallopeptidase [Nitrosomonas mobilis]|nr:neutral zinc metallopeptidase [Nitrosomonas mobilis]
MLTHYTAEQRIRWFRIGFETGEVKRCDTFPAARL